MTTRVDSSMTHQTRGVILPVVLLVILLVGLLGAMFSFRVHADYASTQAIAYRYQTRLAAEAGIERVKLLLRDHRHDIGEWFHNPDELHRIIVWGHNLDYSVVGTNEEVDEPFVFRFSIVADDPADDEDYIRIGILDESAKLNLNTATAEQLLTLMRLVIENPKEINPKHLVDAIIDWRDADSTLSGELPDTEGEYYLKLSKPYLIKNKPYESVEELLLVKGITGQILYGEDYDRNGLLTPNETDNDESFPPDNGDDQLNRGLYPYLTVSSYENNVDNENRSRIYLLAEESQLREDLEKVFEDDPELIEPIIAAVRVSGGNQNNPPNNNQNNNQPNDGSGNNNPPSGQNEENNNPDENSPPNENQNSENENNSDNPQSEGQPQSTTRTLDSPASLMRVRSAEGELIPGPIPMEFLPVLMDRLTVLKPDQRRIDGLINVNTAPLQVLMTLEGITDEEVKLILDHRRSLSAEEMKTTAWLVMNEAVSMDTYERIAPLITARGQQFMIESLGYADHIGMVTRLQVIVDMVGPIAHTIYYRDLTRLGGQYPIREQDRENIRVR